VNKDEKINKKGRIQVLICNFSACCTDEKNFCCGHGINSTFSSTAKANLLCLALPFQRGIG